MRGTIIFAALLLTAGGCHRKSSIFFRDAHASSADAARGHDAELAAAGALAGDDEEDAPHRRGNGKGGGQGAGRWRDTGIYVDGRPVGMLTFGELPIGLKPTWKAEEHSIEFDVGYKGPRTRTSYERRYRFADLLKALGVDLARVKQIQIMGARTTQVLIASGKELRSKKGQELMFRFGAITGGKALPVIPENFGNGKHFDKIGAVMVYINKKPPVLNEDIGLLIDGKPVDGIPYYGQPLRGGVRVYDDDRLTLQLKRPILHELPSKLGADGKEQWNLWTLLNAKGVDTSKIKEGWIIADERRKEKLTRDELAQLTVELDADNNVVLGSSHLTAQALALHDHALRPDELPQIRPDEE